MSSYLVYVIGHLLFNKTINKNINESSLYICYFVSTIRSFDLTIVNFENTRSQGPRATYCYWYSAKKYNNFIKFQKKYIFLIILIKKLNTIKYYGF